MYCRIDLVKTDYHELDDYQLLDSSYYPQIIDLYRTYCDYKKFPSVMPIFVEEIESENTEVLGYYHNNKLVAFSMNYMYTTSNVVVAEQFAWDYQTPKLRLGIRSIQNECARYKRLGYRYLYLGEYAAYKEQFRGFEIVQSLE